MPVSVNYKAISDPADPKGFASYVSRSVQQIDDKLRPLVNIPILSIRDGVTSDTTVGPDEIVVVDPTGGAFNVTLPTVVGHHLSTVIVYNNSASANTVTIISQPGETIRAAASISFAAAWSKRTMIANEPKLEWLVVSS